MKNIFEVALNEIKQTNKLSLPIRKKIWLSYGAVDHSDDMPPKISKGLIKRVQLAEKCAETLIPEWKKLKGSDETPQVILASINKYLKGEMVLEQVEDIVDVFRNQILDETRDSQDVLLYNMGMAICYVADILFTDDQLLYQDEYPDASDDDLDWEMWDASYYTYLVQMEISDDTKSENRKSAEYWLWYVKEAAAIGGVNLGEVNIFKEDRTSQIKEEALYLEKEVTLPNFVKALDATLDFDGFEKSDDEIRIKVIIGPNGGRCHKCNTFSNSYLKYHTASMELPKIKNRKLRISMRSNIFICCNEKCNVEKFQIKPLSMRETLNNYKKYISDSKRKEQLCEFLGIE